MQQSYSNDTRSYKVGILGATGMVGQRFLQLLHDHKWFKVTALGASARSAGKRYAEAVTFTVGPSIPEGVAEMVVVPCKVENFKGKVDFVFSGLDSSVAGEVELEFANAGLPVFSNAKNHRMQDNVPILIPFVNAKHLGLVTSQQSFKESGGFIVTNANCACTGLSVALKPLHEKFVIKEMVVATCQAVSGAGYPGLPSLDIVDNCVPFISGEEPKLEEEPNKILGAVSASGDKIDCASIKSTAMCHRVAVADGHTVSASLRFECPPERENIVVEVKKALSEFKMHPEVEKLPSCPAKSLNLLLQEDRPQPRLDRMEGNGMTTSVGRVRLCPLFDVKFVTVSHNTIVGAAGGSILNAELAAVKGFIRGAAGA